MKVQVESSCLFILNVKPIEEKRLTEVDFKYFLLKKKVSWNLELKSSVTFIEDQVTTHKNFPTDLNYQQFYFLASEKEPPCIFESIFLQTRAESSILVNDDVLELMHLILYPDPHCNIHVLRILRGLVNLR